MKLRNRLSLLVLSFLLAAGSQAQAQSGDRYEVTITNLTANQIFSPPIIAAHSFQTNIFVSGRPAKATLAAVAEDADASGLLDAMGADSEVFDFAIGGGVVLPGKSVTLEVDAQGRYRRLSVVGMLVTTNDAFYGLNNFRLDPRQSFSSLTVPAYDAGTEANTESCDHIPGPPCGNGGVRVTDGAEGFIHVHRGIHGTGDLDPATHDWRNPVASIRIVRK